MLTVSQALTQAAQRDPELAAYYEFHRQLLELQDEHAQTITATLEMADPEALQGRVFHGLPLLAFEQLPIQAERFAKLAMALAQAITSYDPDLAGEPLPHSADEWFTLARKRFEENRPFSEPDREAPSSSPLPLSPSPNPGLAEMAADAALKPYLAWAARQIAPCLDPQAWKRPYCPICGGAPDFAFLEQEVGARQLVCSRCDSQWGYARVGCPFCGESDHAKITYYPSDDEVYRLYVCQACRRYLKTKDLRKGGGQIAAVERVTSVAMDAAARQEGYW